jgi:hypothetical protein
MISIEYFSGEEAPAGYSHFVIVRQDESEVLTAGLYNDFVGYRDREISVGSSATLPVNGEAALERARGYVTALTWLKECQITRTKASTELVRDL